MKNIKILLALLLINISVFSQNDTTKINTEKYSPGFKFKEGIYVNYYQFKNNSPLPKTKIVTDINIKRLDFFDVILQNKTIKFFNNKGALVEIPTDKIWGFCNRSVIYINYNNEFNRIPVMGRISHFVANFTYTEYDPYGTGSYQYNYRGGVTTYRTELRQYVIDYESGKIYDFNSKIIETLIITDNNLYDEFVNLSVRKKKKQKFIYLRKFNEKNPIYFPK